MNCIKCSNLIPDGFVFCTGCGNKTEEIPVNEVVIDSPLDESVTNTVPKMVLTVVLSLLFFIFSAIIIALMVIRPENIIRAVPQADVAWILDELELREELDEELRKTPLNHASVDDLNRFLNRENVSTEIGNILEKYFIAILENDLNYYITAREIVSSVRAVSTDIYEEFDYRLTNEDFNSLSNALSNNMNLRDYSIGNLMDEVEISFTVPFILFSSYLLIILLTLCFIILFNLFLVHRKRIRTLFISIGISMSVLGLIYIIVGLIFGPLSNAINGDTMQIISRVAGGITGLILLAGFICLIFGMTLITTFFIIKKMNGIPSSRIIATNNGVIWNLIGIIGNVVGIITCSVFIVIILQNTI
ncbi:MAG: hypothetical protein LBD23_19565 [Oscillospiraceae bacterium]|jgi:hypothetical protein|nr:hypothetical protein [Oscillospiraceae bacterium]